MNRYNWYNAYTSLALAGPSGIRAGWGIEINGRYEAKRLPVSAGLPSGGQAAFMIPMHPLYSTKPHGLVQAIYVPGSRFWSVILLASLDPHCIKWVNDKQGSSLGSFPTFSPLYPHFSRPSGFWPSVKSCLMGGSDKNHTSDIMKKYWHLVDIFPYECP